MAELHESIILRDIFSIQERSSELAWQPLKEGVEIFPLYGGENKEQGASAALLRYAPGSHVPPHQHLGYEHILVLSGAQSDENGHYPAGTLIVSPANSAHSINSDTGCIVLAIWEKPVKFL